MSSSSSSIAIQFDGSMSRAEASTLAASLLYNPVCCDVCVHFLRTLREFHSNSNLPALRPHPGIWIGAADRLNILSHALSSQRMRLALLRSKVKVGTLIE